MKFSPFFLKLERKRRHAKIAEFVADIVAEIDHEVDAISLLVQFKDGQALSCEAIDEEVNRSSILRTFADRLIDLADDPRIPDDTTALLAEFRSGK